MSAPASDLIWALVSGFAGSRRWGRSLFMLQAYIDDSVGNGIYAMAGYIASAKQWALFSDEWQQFLEMRPRIAYFKYSEAMHLTGEFRFWRPEARDEKMALLYKIIGEYVSASLASALYIEDHKRLFADLPQQVRSPYHLLLYSMISEIATHQGLLNIDGAIDFIFDENVMERDKIYSGWETFKRATAVPKHLIGAMPVFRNDITTVPLQAADMLAGRMLAGWKSGLAIVDPLPIPHFPNQRNVPGLELVWTEKELIAMRSRMALFGRTILTGTFGRRGWASAPVASQ
jgi:hypothetical protein